MGPLLAFSVVAALLGGGAGAFAYYQDHYGPDAPPTSVLGNPVATDPSGTVVYTGGPAAGQAVPIGYLVPQGTPLGTTSGGRPIYAVGPTPSAPAAGPTRTLSTAASGTEIAAGGSSSTGGPQTASGHTGSSPSASGMAALQSVETNAAHLIGGLI